jgi:hypothetical protein
MFYEFLAKINQLQTYLYWSSVVIRLKYVCPGIASNETVIFTEIAIPLLGCTSKDLKLKGYNSLNTKNSKSA